MWDHLALLGPRRRSAHPRLERVCSLSVCQLFRLSRFVPDFNVSGKTAEPKMAFNFAHLLSAACGGAPRRLGRLRRPWARCARLFWGGYQHRKSAFLSTSQYSVEQNRGTRPTSPQTVPRLAAMTVARPQLVCVPLSLSGVNTPTHSSVTVSSDFAALRHRSGTHAGEARQAAVRPRNRLPSLS